MKFYIDFTGFCTITANSIEEAREKFWELIYNDTPLPNTFYEINEIEKQNR